MINQEIGFVVIARNEGDRLKKCIQSLENHAEKIVYVDSGSTDGSVEFCKNRAIETIELDLSKPFTAGRARNEGFERLLERFPDVDFVHFIDGDCCLSDSWLPEAIEFLKRHNEVAIVCGVRKEIDVLASSFNMLCDIEWNGSKGLIKSCGGDFLIRASAMKAVGGFNPSVVAGEEPEMCFRLRQQGFQIYRLNSHMTYHDASMFTLRQWWRRNLRSGHAYANVAHLHLDSAERINQKEIISIFFWGAVLPLIGIFSLFYFYPGSILVVILYLYLFLKCVNRGRKVLNLSRKHAIIFSAHIVIGKLPHLIGLLKYTLRTFFSRKLTIIEYK